jgi:5-formyltetrahydrofolate cyclo-ligase
VPADPRKDDLRLHARARRRDAHARFGVRIGPVLRANFMQAFSLPVVAVVAGYHAIGEEADIDPLLTALHERGHPVGLPRVVAPAAPLQFHAWVPGDALDTGYRKIPEPAANAPVIEPDFLLVPLLAYDATGHRLGYGGGFYDRTLAALRAARTVLVIGIAYSDQRVDSLPAGDHDQRLDAVLTELGVERFGLKDEA